MKFLSLLLVPGLALGQVPDAGAVDGGAGVDSLYVQCGDAPLMEPIDGGYFVPERRQQRNNCKLAACEFYANGKMKEPETSAAPASAVIILVSAALVLFGGGIVVGYLAPHPAPK